MATQVIVLVTSGAEPIMQELGYTKLETPPMRLVRTGENLIIYSVPESEFENLARRLSLAEIFYHQVGYRLRSLLTS